MSKKHSDLNRIRTHDLCDTNALISILLPSPRPSPLFPVLALTPFISIFAPQPHEFEFESE